MSSEVILASPWVLNFCFESIWEEAKGFQWELSNW